MSLEVRDILYSNFSRNVGNPYQSPIHNQGQLNRFVSLNNGVNDSCFVSTCFYQGKRPVFDDLFLETDFLNIEPMARIGQWYNEHGIDWIPVFSANRGFHIHGLFEPEIVQQQTVKKLADQILKDTRNEGVIDAHVVGNFKCMARIPNTKRLNGLWCIPLSQEMILDNPPISTIFSLAKSPQSIYYNIKKRPKITEFVQDVKVEEHITPKHKSLPKESFFLKDVLRPCVHNKLISPNPSHLIRISAVIEMLNQSIPIPQILDSLESLEWIDFDRTYSRYQVESIEEKWKQGIAHPISRKKIGCTKKTSCINCILRG